MANQRPENPIMFLANFLLNYANGGGGAGENGVKQDPLKNVNGTTNVSSQRKSNAEFPFAGHGKATTTNARDAAQETGYGCGGGQCNAGRWADRGG